MLENVKNLTSHNGGETFRIILQTLRDELGYEVHYKVIDGQHFVPQHRERILPNKFVWWDKKEKTALMGPTSSYYGFSTRGVAQIMRLGWSMMRQARRAAPKAGSIVVITSGLDDAVDEKNLDRVIAQWQRHGYVHVTRYKFDKTVAAFHDMIDPQQPYQKTAVVYPKLVELIETPV